jgi:polyhydroxybutyrate depolymerase
VRRWALTALLAAVAAGCGHHTRAPAAATGKPRAGPPRSDARSGPCQAAPRAGDFELHLIDDTPPVLVHVPDGIPAGRRVPLVLGIHGAGQDGRGFESESNWSTIADDHHFLVAYPQSWRDRHFWAWPEADSPRSGIRILRATVAAMERRYCVDAGRILASGISSGGRMTYSAGCQMADVLRAIAPVSAGVVDHPPCHMARPISLLDTHGTADPIVDYDGVMPVVRRWAAAVGCKPRPARHAIDSLVIRLQWRSCNGVSVQHIRVVGGRHAWLPIGAPAGVTLDGSELIWRWFSRL